MPARTPQLEAAFLATRYEVQTPFGAATLRPNRPCPALADLHGALGVAESGLLTAWNPLSVPCTAEANAIATARLAARIQGLGLPHWPAWHRAPEPRWDELGFFVAGIGSEALRELGRRFGQHAVLHAGADGLPWLVWL